MIITRTVTEKFALTNETFEKMLDEAFGCFNSNDDDVDVEEKEKCRKNPAYFFEEYTLEDLEWDDNLSFIDQDITTTVE